MKKTLQGFYQAYLDWVEDGATPFLPFSRCSGLCGNLRYYMGSDNVLSLNSLELELMDQFLASGLEMAYPFGEEDFNLRLREGTMHLDPKRLAWVKNQLQEGENQ